MLRQGCIAAILLFVIVAAACDDNGPTTPTGLSVVVYQDTNFRGDNRPLPLSVPNLDDVPGCGGAGADWNDCISSIRVPSGWSVTIYDEDNYTGSSATVTADVPDLHQLQGPCGDDWDDCIASIQVRQR